MKLTTELRALISTASWWAIVLSVVVVFVLALHPAWKTHAMVDGYFAFYDRALYFWNHGNLTEIPFNEYQPGAVFFFVALSPVFWLSQLRDDYVVTLLLSNVALIAVLSGIFKKYSMWAVGLFSVVVLAAGPLTLYRFELFCQLCIVLAFLAGKRKWYSLTGFFLGVATMIKVYPVLLVPIWMILTAPEHFKSLKSWENLKPPISVALGWVMGMLFVLLSYCALFQVAPSAVLDQVLVHAHKPIHVESIPGSFMIAKTIILEHRSPNEYSNLIYGVHPNEYGGLAPILPWLWIVPVSFMYGLLWLRRSYSQEWVTMYSVSIISLFLISTSQLGPQYLLWFALWWPLLSVTELSALKPVIIKLTAMLALLLFLTQTLFPLWYSELLLLFKIPEISLALVLLIARNALLIIWALACTKAIWKYQKI